MDDKLLVTDGMEISDGHVTANNNANNYSSVQSNLLTMNGHYDESDDSLVSTNCNHVENSGHNNHSTNNYNDVFVEQRLSCSCSEDEEMVELLNGYPNELSPSRVEQLEEEQELLNGSLMALTSHFAQVQLRLKQIVDANQDEREELLKELEHFANRGIPDIRQPEKFSFSRTDENNESNTIENKLELQRIKQKELIEKLKDQLEDLEKYAYETGDIVSIPSSMLLERQTVIIEQLKGKLPLNLDELDKLSPEQLRTQVDKAIRDLINPVIMKEQLVSQLKTQITDLERFIQFLQGPNNQDCTCDCPTHGNSQKSLEPYNELKAEDSKRRNHKKNCHNNSDDDSETAIKMIRRALTILQIFTMAQFGCGNIRQFERNTLKKTPRGNHWGDLRARLELAVDHILEIQHEKHSNDSDYTSDSDESPTGLLCNERLTAAVRKELCTALRDLLQHGLSAHTAIDDSMSPSIFNWGCFSTRSQLISKPMHAWDVIIKFYELKNGFKYNASPARRLSQAFNLQIVGGVAITHKQTLLSCIDDIIETHTRLKRSSDSHFKAFVCTALNEGKLVNWLKLVAKSRTIVDMCYEKWSYLSSTGFDDSLRCLDRLSKIRFHLATDLAIRQLQNIHDVF